MCRSIGYLLKWLAPASPVLLGIGVVALVSCTQEVPWDTGEIRATDNFIDEMSHFLEKGMRLVSTEGMSDASVKKLIASTATASASTLHEDYQVRWMPTGTRDSDQFWSCSVGKRPHYSVVLEGVLPVSQAPLVDKVIAYIDSPEGERVWCELVDSAGATLSRTPTTERQDWRVYKRE